MLAIEVTCNRCGIEFAPDREAFTRGTWHTCPACRGDPDRKVSGGLEADSSGSQGQRNGRKCQVETDPR
jgi:hypothetical protein